MRTYTRAELDESRAAWEALRLDASWEPVRRAAADAGLIRPPSGTRWDQWDDPYPSQFAVVAQAMDEGWADRVVGALRAPGSRSWSDVVRRLIAERGGRADAAELADRDAAWERAHRPDGPEATMILADVMRRVADSAGIEGTTTQQRGTDE